jgi:predicted dehydrogenase
MRFALLGNHPDGLAMACALRATSRHELAAYCGPKAGADELLRHGMQPKLTGDMEEILSDPGIEVVIVAGPPGDRASQLRRALQSERHVLCVHPADQSPDSAYEAAMIQGDTKQVLLPLLPEAFHPGVVQLRELLHKPEAPLGEVGLIVVEQAAETAVLYDAGLPGYKPGLPGWSMLRALSGEIAEVSAFAPEEELSADQPVLVAGRFESGVMFQLSLLPQRERASQTVRVFGSQGVAMLTMVSHSSTLAWGKREDERQVHIVEAANPWMSLVEVFEAAVVANTSEANAPRLARPTWQDEIRCLELDDAARRSVERRRASTLEYQEVSEEVGFKGTMTLLGCGLLWSLLVLVVLAAWDRRFLWLVAPLLVIFLGLQLLRWVIPRPAEGAKPNSGNNAPAEKSEAIQAEREGNAARR